MLSDSQKAFLVTVLAVVAGIVLYELIKGAVGNTQTTSALP